MSDTPSQQQVDIFSSDQGQLEYAELCNALYERELLSLSQRNLANSSLLKRRLAGLSHHVKRAAEQLLTNPSPIKVDVHNGSWQSKQAGKCVADKISPEKNRSWFHQNAKMGIPVPVYAMELGVEKLQLDSIDKIEHKSQELHLNKHGWFSFDGESLETKQSHYAAKRLLLPNKATMSAACSGHTWNHKGKAQTRTLSLRELLLSTTINWKKFN